MKSRPQKLDAPFHNRQQGKAEFEASTLPALRAVCANMVSAPSPKRKQQQQQQQGVATEGAGTAAAPAAAPPPPLPPTTAVATPAALVLLERAPFLAPRCPPDLLLPLVCRALDTESDSSALSSSSSALSASASADASAASAVARAQELAAAASPSVGASAGPQVSEAQLLPRLHRLALATTAARVRAACFRALGEICAGGSVRAEGVGGGESARSASTPSSFQEQRRAPEPLPREAAVAALASFARAAAVDGSASTADAGIDLASSLASRWGQTLAAQSIIPALSPLLAHGEEVLPDDAFGRVAEAIRGHVAAIQAERARRRRGGGGGGGERGAGGPATARALLPAGATKPAAAAPAPAAAAVAAGVFAASAAPRTQATPHPLFAAPAPATKAPPPPAVLLPPPPPPPASVAVGTKRHLFFPPPPAAAAAAAAAATAPPWAADRVPSLGLSSDLFGEWSVAEATGGSGGGGGEKARCRCCRRNASRGGGRRRRRRRRVRRALRRRRPLGEAATRGAAAATAEGQRQCPRGSDAAASSSSCSSSGERRGKRQHLPHLGGKRKSLKTVTQQRYCDSSNTTHLLAQRMRARSEQRKSPPSRIRFKIQKAKKKRKKHSSSFFFFFFSSSSFSFPSFPSNFPPDPPPSDPLLDHLPFLDRQVVAIFYLFLYISSFWQKKACFTHPPKYFPARR